MRQELQKLGNSKSWASLLHTAPVAGPSLVYRKNFGVAPKAGPAGVATGVRPAAPAPGRGKLVFVLTAPGELTAESFKATTTHVARRDALARIATAALWRGRGLAWDDVHEIVPRGDVDIARAA